jgi:hypothetical protein
MPPPNRSIPGRTPHLFRRVRLCVEALDGREVPALLGLTLPTLPTLPVSFGLDVPIITRLIDLDVGGNVGPLSANVVAAPAADPATPTGGPDVSIGRLVSLDVGPTLGTPDIVVTPPVVTPPTVSSPIPTTTPPVVTRTTPLPNTPTLTDSVPVSPVVGQPPVLPPVDAPTVTPLTPVGGGATSTEILTAPTLPTAPSASTTPDVTTPGLENALPRPQTVPTATVTPSATVGTTPAAPPASAAFAIPAIESELFTPVAVTTPPENTAAEPATAGEQTRLAHGAVARQTEATLAAVPDAGTVVGPVAPPVPVLEEPLPEAPPVPPGEYPVDAAVLLSGFSLFDPEGAATDPPVVLDSLGAIEFLGESGWWYAAALAGMYVGRKGLIARWRKLRRPFALPA